MPGIQVTGQIDSTTGVETAQDSTGGAANGYEASLGAGDEGVSSPNLSLKRGINRAHCAKLASSIAAQVIGGNSGVPVYVKSIRQLGPTVDAITIAGFSTPSAPASLANTVVLPANATTVPIELLSPGIAHAFSAGCTIQCATAADGPLILVCWEVMP